MEFDATIVDYLDVLKKKRNLAEEEEEEEEPSGRSGPQSQRR